MTIVDESPATLNAARGITGLTPKCSHRHPDGTSAWTRELRIFGRGGCGASWVCSLCGAGDPEAETVREAVRECVDDRA